MSNNIYKIFGILILIVIYTHKVYSQDYISQFQKCEKKIYKIEYEDVFGESKKHIYIHCFYKKDTLYNVKATSVENDTLRLDYLLLIDLKSEDRWFYSWERYYNTYFLSSISIKKKQDSGISNIYKIFRENPKSVYRFSDYTKTPVFEEYYNVGERIIDTDIILTFPKFFKKIQGVMD